MTIQTRISPYSCPATAIGSLCFVVFLACVPIQKYRIYSCVLHPCRKPWHIMEPQYIFVELVAQEIK